MMASLFDANPTLPRSAIERAAGQKRRILERLNEGPATNSDLMEIAHRFGARLQELREYLKPLGWEITTTTLSGQRGVYLYTLKRSEAA